MSVQGFIDRPMVSVDSLLDVCYQEQCGGISGGNGEGFAVERPGWTSHSSHVNVTPSPPLCQARLEGSRCTTSGHWYIPE